MTAARALPFFVLGLVVFAALWQWRKERITHEDLHSELMGLRIAYRELAARPPVMAEPAAVSFRPVAQPIPKAIPVEEEPLPDSPDRKAGETGNPVSRVSGRSDGAEATTPLRQPAAGLSETGKPGTVDDIPMGNENPLPAIPTAAPEDRTVELERVVQFLRQELNAALETIERLKASSPSAE